MLDEETYKKELVRMWDSLRTENKGLNYCEGVSCKYCPLLAFGGCKSAIDSLDIYKTVKEWSDEHPNEEEK